MYGMNYSKLPDISHVRIRKHETHIYEIRQWRSSDNDSTGFWPPGSLHTLGADGHI